MVSCQQEQLYGPPPEERGHSRISLATYYRYFRAGGSYLVLTTVLLVFLLGEVKRLHSEGHCIVVADRSSSCLPCHPLSVSLFYSSSYSSSSSTSSSSFSSSSSPQGSVVLSDWWISDWYNMHHTNSGYINFMRALWSSV